MSNLVAAALLSAHPDADAVELAFSFSAAGASGAAGGQFVHRHLTSRRHHRSAVVPFPPPAGPRRCLEFAESEAGWLGELAEGRTITTYARFAPTVLNATLLALNRLHLISALPHAAFAHSHKAVPSQATAEPVTEWVAVLRQGIRLAARTIEGQGGYRITAAATVVLANALLDPATGAPATPGCFDPQELFTLQMLEGDLRKAGLKIAGQPSRSRA